MHQPVACGPSPQLSSSPPQKEMWGEERRTGGLLRRRTPGIRVVWKDTSEIQTQSDEIESPARGEACQAT